jgi:hypothetical protein
MNGMCWHRIAAVLVIPVLLISGSRGAQELYTGLFPPGKYPPGPIYKAEDLPQLVGKHLSGPTYLIGLFFYVGKVDGKDSFATFTMPPLRLGNTAVIITFHRNFPRDLVPGKGIKADKREPIALTAVKRAADGRIVAFGENIFSD